MIIFLYPEVQKAGRLADNPKRQSLVGGGLEKAKLPFSGFQRAEPFGGYEVEKKVLKDSFWGSFHLPALFGTEETRGRGDMPSTNRSRRAGKSMNYL